MYLEDLDTPELIVDLDGLEDNLDRYQRYNEHDRLVAVRGGQVEAIWPVHARGKIR